MSKIQVMIIESERGWGQRVDEEKYFDTLEEAEKFCTDYNASNNLDHVPDWYMFAMIPGHDKLRTRMMELSGTIRKAP